MFPLVAEPRLPLASPTAHVKMLRWKVMKKLRHYFVSKAEREAALDAADVALLVTTQHVMLCRPCYRAMGLWHRAMGLWHGAMGLWHRAIGLWHRAMGLWHRAMGLWHRAMGLWHRAMGRVV